MSLRTSETSPYRSLECLQTTSPHCMILPSTRRLTGNRDATSCSGSADSDGCRGEGAFLSPSGFRLSSESVARRRGIVMGCFSPCCRRSSSPGLSSGSSPGCCNLDDDNTNRKTLHAGPTCFHFLTGGQVWRQAVSGTDLLAWLPVVPNRRQTQWYTVHLVEFLPLQTIKRSKFRGEELMQRTHVRFVR